MADRAFADDYYALDFSKYKTDYCTLDYQTTIDKTVNG